MVLVSLTKVVRAAENSASGDSENLPEPKNADGIKKPDRANAEAENGAEQKKEKTTAQEDKEEENKPADPDTGKSTLSPETMGLLPNPL